MVFKPKSQAESISVHEHSMDLDFMEFLPEADSTPTKNLLVIKAAGSDGADQTQISFNPNATANYDKDYDALKFIISSKVRPQIFTFGGDFMLSVNQLPDTGVMDLFVQAAIDGIFTLSVDKNVGFDFVVLEDLIWDTKIDLLNQDYPFEYFTTDEQYPFKLYFNKEALNPPSEGDIQIYYYPESIVVKSSKLIDFAYITFYDLAGRVALELEAKDFVYFEKPVILPVGHYIVQLRSADFTVNHKVLVRK